MVRSYAETRQAREYPANGDGSTIRLLVFLVRRVFEGAEWVRRSERVLAAAIWTAYALHVVGILPELWQLLDQISFHVGKGGFRCSTSCAR